MNKYEIVEIATVYDYARMCKYHGNCNNCPLGIPNNSEGTSCDYLLRAYPDKANDIILNWCKDHPVKTRQSSFLKIFPNAQIEKGVINICPRHIDTDIVCSDEMTCDACKNAYWFGEGFAEWDMKEVQK